MKFCQQTNKGSNKERKNSHLHSNSVRVEGPCWGIIFEATEEVIVAYGIEFCVALETVNRTLALNCVGALNIIVIGEEDLLGAMELTTTTDRLLRSVVPSNMNFHVGSPAVGLDLLHSGYIRRLRGVCRPHQHAFSSCSPCGTSKTNFFLQSEKWKFTRFVERNLLLVVSIFHGWLKF